MKLFTFDERDMLNPDERVEYTTYLKNVEKTISKKLNKQVNVYGGSKLQLKTQPQPQYKKLKLTLLSIHSSI